MDELDLTYMRLAIEVAQRAREHGNHPFGAILVDGAGQILLSAENSVVTERDCTGHAETNLMRRATQQYDADFLARCTLYSSAEPCPMCAGAIFWGNVRRVVYGLGQAGLYALIGAETEESLQLSCRDVLRSGGKPVEVIGPMLEEEALAVHIGFWTAADGVESLRDIE